MAISALSKAAVHAIGAGQILADPTAIVKELVDNALDAHATSIVVQITSNTLSAIQVRDNGHGIMPVDRVMVARRHCTSKITCEDDLQVIGGSSLGFRGEALGSAAQLSGSLTITTRIEGEQAATVLIVDRFGQIARTEQASPPVGTTVRITDFLAPHPVRRQIASKNSDLTIRRIRRMLQAYSFARSRIRLSLQITNARNDKDNFIYTPTAKTNLEDVTLKLVGNPCASQCMSSQLNEEGYHLHAYLPRPDADPSKVSGIGAFISVDGRPLSASKGTCKQIARSFRESLLQAGDKFSKVKDPFLYLQVGCPAGSYDVNIEPDKDDILFEDSSLVMDLVGRVFKACYDHERARTYPRLDNVAMAAIHSSTDQEHAISEMRIERFLGDMQSRTATDLMNESLSTHTQSPGKQRSSFQPNMFAFDENDTQLTSTSLDIDDTEADPKEDIREADLDVRLSNPWVLAKLNTSRTQHDNANHEAVSNIQPESKPLNASSQLQRYTHSPREPVIQSLPSLQSSSAPSNVDSSQLCGTSGVHYDVTHKRMLDTSNPLDNQLLTPPSSYVSQVAAGRNYEQNHELRDAMSHPTSTPATEGVNTGTRLMDIPDISSRTTGKPRRKLHQTGLKKPFAIPIARRPPKEKVWFDHLEGVDKVPRQPHTKRRKHRPDGAGLVVQGDEAQPYEPQMFSTPANDHDIRSYISTSNIGGRFPMQNDFGTPELRTHRVDACAGADSTEDESLPDKPGALCGQGPLRLDEVAALEAHVKALRDTSLSKPYNEANGLDVSDPDNNPLPSADHQKIVAPLPRKKSLNRARRRDPARFSRRASTQLPLEQVPPHQRTQNVVQKVRTSIGKVSKLVEDSDLAYVVQFSDAIDEPTSIFTSSLLNVTNLTMQVHALLSVTNVDPVSADYEGLARELQAAFASYRSMIEGVHDDMLDLP